MAIGVGKRVHDLINKQINEEFVSSYLYLAMSNVLFDMGLEGAAGWVKKRSTEEYSHGMKILDYMNLRSAKIKLLPIPAPKQDWRAPLHIFEEITRNEGKVTANINSLYEYAIADKDYQTQCFLTWFVNEQIEEEATSNYLLNRLRKMQTTDLGVIMFDAELAKRD